VIAPGILGGLLFLIIQVLYIPNAAFIGLAYLTGIGFKLGAGTTISASHFTLHGIPAIPLFAALPTGRHPLLQLGLVALLLFALIALLPVVRENSLFKSRQFFAVRTLLVMLVIVTVFAYLSSGELLTSEMNPVGVTWWRVTAYFAAASVLALAATVYIPAGIRRMAKRG